LAAFGKAEFGSCDQVFVTTILPRRLEEAHVHYWLHLTDKPPAPEFVAYWTNNGKKAALGLDLSAAIDPTASAPGKAGKE
jgi:hypothetical protein